MSIQMKRKNKAPAKRRITRQSAKAKGRSLQQWVCEQISKLVGLPWGPDECIASREASQNGTDVRLIGPALEAFPFSVECKWQETWSIPEWIRQARTNQIPDTDWLLVVKRNYEPAVVVMNAQRFFDLLAHHQGGPGDNAS